jgi:hypothetical protein
MVYICNNEKVAKKERSTAYDEIDRYINRVTDESIISSASGKMIDGMRQILIMGTYG